MITISLLPVPDNFIPVIIIGIIAAVLIIIGVLVLKRRKAHSRRADEDPEIAALMGEPHHATPTTRQKPETHIRAAASADQGSAAAARAAPPVDRTIELVKGRADITESLRALAEKYSLNQFTLATSDGLVFASSGSASAQDDAAVFGGRFAKDPHVQVQGVQLFSLDHKGSVLIGIVRAKRPADDRILAEMSADTKDILNWWI